MHKKAFTLPTQGFRAARANGTATAAHPQQKYAQNPDDSNYRKFNYGFQDDYQQPSPKTRYTRQPESILANGDLGKFPTSAKTTPKLGRSSNKRSVNDIDFGRTAAGNYRTTSDRHNFLSSSINSNHSIKRESDLELAYLRAAEPTVGRRMSTEDISMGREDVKRVSNPLNQYPLRNIRQDESTSNTPIHRNWFDQQNEERSKHGNGNGNLDIVSLHSMVSKKSIKTATYPGWMVNLSYTLAGILLWTFIIICIEEIDGTVGQQICKPAQEIRYWASFVCLVVIVTAVTVYFQKGDPAEAVVLFLLNTITFVSIHHIPLSCIRNNKISERGMGRLRGGLNLFLIVTLFLTWLLNKYLASKKALPWISRE